MYQLTAGTGYFLSTNKGMTSNYKFTKANKEGIFYIRGTPFKIFISKGDNRNNAKYALLRLDTGQRVSGLFPIASGFSGDIRIDNSRYYFRLYLERLQEGFNIDCSELENALIKSGMIDNTQDVELFEFDVSESDIEGNNEGMSIST